MWRQRNDFARVYGLFQEGIQARNNHAVSGCYYVILVFYGQEKAKGALIYAVIKLFLLIRVESSQTFRKLRYLLS